MGSVLIVSVKELVILRRLVAALFLGLVDLGDLELLLVVVDLLPRPHWHHVWPLLHGWHSQVGVVSVSDLVVPVWLQQRSLEPLGLHFEPGNGCLAFLDVVEDPLRSGVVLDVCLLLELGAGCLDPGVVGD